VDVGAQTENDQAVAEDEPETPYGKEADECDGPVGAEEVFARVGVVDAHAVARPQRPGRANEQRADPVAHAGGARENDRLKDVQEVEDDERRADRDGGDAVPNIHRPPSGAARSWSREA